MKVQPTTTNKPQPTFTHKMFKKATITSYGKCIHGGNNGFDYNVYVDGNKENTFYKLYYITKNNKWVKSVLKFFSNNKLHKEVKSVAKTNS